MARTVVIACVLLVLLPGADTRASAPAGEALHYVAARAREHDVLLLGTQHQRPVILGFMRRVLPLLKTAGVTHVGLEIGSDQQERLTRFLRHGTGLDTIEVFSGIDCAGYRRLLRSVRRQGLQAVALDLPADRRGSGAARDHWMAARVAQLFRQRPDARLAVIAGNLHTVKTLAWRSSAVRSRVLRAHLARLRPDLSAFSIAGCSAPPGSACGVAPVPASTQRPLALATAGARWQPAILQPLAVHPMTAAQVMDAIILH